MTNNDIQNITQKTKRLNNTNPTKNMGKACAPEGQAVLVPYVSGKGIVDMLKPNVLERNIHYP